MTGSRGTWGYQCLLFGRPIALEVLGIAPNDRLGELAWLGPASVALFGIVLPAAVILAATLVAAIHTRLQGILITGMGLAVFIVAMLLIPRLKREKPLPHAPCSPVVWMCW